MKNFYEIFGLGRSGHHAMTNWVIKNFIGVESELGNKLNLFPDKKFFYINEANLDEHLTNIYINDHAEKNKNFIVTYENCRIDYTFFNEEKRYTSKTCFTNKKIEEYSNNRIIFIRNFFDNLASRQESNVKNKNNIFDIGDDFFDLWKQQAYNILEKGQYHLKYEDWIVSPKKRTEFLKETIGTYEIYDNNVLGTKSSYGDKNYLNRFDSSKITDEIKDMIISDDELKHLINGLKYKYKL